MRSKAGCLLVIIVAIILLLGTISFTSGHVHSAEDGDHYFAIEILSYDEILEEGDILVVDYLVENNGDREGTSSIEFVVGSEVKETSEISLEKGEKHEDEFEWIPRYPGVYDIELKGEDEIKEMSIMVYFQDSDWKLIDDFRDQIEGSEPIGWEIYEDDTLETDFDICSTEYYDRNKSLFVKGSRADVYSRGDRSFPPLLPERLKLYYRREPEIDWRESYKDRHSIDWQDEDDNEVLNLDIYTHGYPDDGMSWEPTGGYVDESEEGYDGNAKIAGSTEVWYEIQWKNIDWEQGTYDIIVIDTRDYEEIANWENLEFDMTEREISQLQISAKGWGTEGAHLDKISLSPQQEHFRVDIVDFDSEIAVGEDTSIEYEVRNTGETSGEQSIVLEVEGEEEDYTEVKLEKNETYKSEFKLDTKGYDTRDYELVVRSEDDAERVTTTILEPAFFEVEIMNPQNGEEFCTGEKVNVSYKIINIGETRDLQNVSFYIDDDLIEKEEAELEENESFIGGFSWKSESAGDLNLSISSEDDEKTITISVLGESDFEVNILGVAIIRYPVRRGPGLSVSVYLSYIIENRGDVEDTQEIEFMVSDQKNDEKILEDSKEMTVDANRFGFGIFTWETNTQENAGWYNLEIRTEDDDRCIEVQIPSGNIRW